jgi:hypothetical protein
MTNTIIDINAQPAGVFFLQPDPIKPATGGPRSLASSLITSALNVLGKIGDGLNALSPTYAVKQPFSIDQDPVLNKRINDLIVAGLTVAAVYVIYKGLKQ